MIKTVIEILSAALTPVIAVIAIYIAYQQFRINRSRLAHGLYERRLAVFKAVRSFIGDVARLGSTDFSRVTQFYAEAAEADFLFGQDVTDVIEKLYDQGLRLAELKEQLYPPPGERALPKGEERSRVAHAKSEVLKWFFDQLPEIKKVFKRYLQMNM